MAVFYGVHKEAVSCQWAAEVMFWVRRERSQLEVAVRPKQVVVAVVVVVMAVKEVNVYGVRACNEAVGEEY